MDLSKAVWRKASRSTSNGGNCVEVASVPGTTAIRDSKDPSGPKLIMSHNDFRRFTEILKNL
ncbi:DUF397 domain-containing protein [Actinomadura bangladeshensis]|uniref:DUF397 domain-containing protein n=1 Tax=Actinomadura bangladeshensis TaxID=453573 RepID=A0A4R4NIF9_9ACTN|nr:DUF397 domain-containing protein [Actinomadura bangladeshensis]TDC07400.1 DUF397 domain-containing protein [Actinomadura bangladeshensis]